MNEDLFGSIAPRERVINARPVNAPVASRNYYDKPADELQSDDNFYRINKYYRVKPRVSRGKRYFTIDKVEYSEAELRERNVSIELIK